MCRKLGISSASPRFWKEGKQPRPSTVKKIADYFGVDVEFFDKPFPEPPQLEEPPKFIPVHVITAEENKLLHMYESLGEKEKQAVYKLIEMLSGN